MKLEDKVFTGITTGIMILFASYVINLIATGVSSNPYRIKRNTINKQYNDVMNEINALEEIKKDVPGIMNANGVLEYICEKQITADSLKKEEEFYQKKIDRANSKAIIYGYFIH